jgi:type VI protein secretion system component Hcp
MIRRRRQMLKKLSVLTLLAAFLIVPCAAEDMYAAFVLFEGVPGEATYQGNSGWIALRGFKVGPEEDTGDIANPVITAGAARYTGPNMSAIGSLDGMGIEMTKLVDKSSPKIMSIFRGNGRIPGAKLCLCNAVDHGTVIYSFTLRDVSIKNLAQKGNQEVLTLNFEKIEFR